MVRSLLLILCSYVTIEPKQEHMMTEDKMIETSNTAKGVVKQKTDKGKKEKPKTPRGKREARMSTKFNFDH